MSDLRRRGQGTRIEGADSRRLGRQRGRLTVRRRRAEGAVGQRRRSRRLTGNTAVDEIDRRGTDRGCLHRRRRRRGRRRRSSFALDRLGFGQFGLSQRHRHGERDPGRRCAARLGGRSPPHRGRRKVSAGDSDRPAALARNGGSHAWAPSAGDVHGQLGALDVLCGRRGRRLIIMRGGRARRLVVGFGHDHQPRGTAETSFVARDRPMPMPIFIASPGAKLAELRPPRLEHHDRRRTEMKDSQLLAAPNGLRVVIATMADGRAREPGPVRGHVVIIRHRHVTDTDCRHHDDRAEPAAVHLDERHEPLVADEQARLRGDALGTDGEQAAGDVPPPDDAPSDGRMHPVIVLGRQIGDEVRASHEARRDLLVAQQLGQIEQGPLRLDQLSRGGQTALDHDSIGRRDDPPRLVGDRARARAQPAGEKLVEVGVVPERLLRLVEIDPVSPREPRQHHAAQTLREARGSPPSQ